MTQLPVGTLTFMLTDLQGSTRTWESETRAMREAMVQHDLLLYRAVERDRGALVETGREGDSILAVFTTARDAALCARDIQRDFRAARWPERAVLRTRIALHTGEVELRGGHYFGPPLNRCARVLALGHGGQTLVTEATHQLLIEDLPDEVELTDLGVHRLKDLKRSERVFQLTDLRDPVQFPPLRARREYRTNLPIPLTSFVGRERELQELRELSDQTRLLTLTGPGGSGKTRLAKELALEVVGSFVGGAWFVDLAPVTDAALVARTIAAALDVDEQQGRPVESTLVDHLRSEPTLLVLDNCEHLIATAAEIAQRLLSSCPDLRIVATSREPLNIGGETAWRIPGLSPDDALRLFLERARTRAAPAPSLDAERPTIDTLCARLDHIPLAIELAAARVATIPPREILRRLEGGIGVLAGGERTAARRQRTLEATVDWSFDLLDPDERVLLRRVAVFVGSFSLDAAETVCADDGLPRAQVMDRLAQLVAKSLVQLVDGRYRLLGTIRAYASAKVTAAGERERIEAAHARYFAGVIATRRPGALGLWLERIDDEHDDIRAAIAWTIDHDAELAATMADGMYEFWLGRGYALEARPFLAQIDARLDPTSRSHAAVLLGSGVFAYTAGDFAAAPELVDRALEAARASAERELITRALIAQGNVALASGNVDLGQRALDEALHIAREMGHSRGEADALHHLGSLANIRGDPQLARSRYTESLEIRRRLGTMDEAGTTLTLRAFCDILLKNVDQARADIIEALRAALVLHDRRAAWSLDVIACLEALAGESERALVLASAADAQFAATAQRPPKVWRSFTDPLIGRARTAVASDVAEARAREGAQLDFDQALRYALNTQAAIVARV